jgi:hypothetical protein
VTEATPEPFSALVPKAVVVLWKSTLPVGVPLADVTVAVSVTVLPYVVEAGAAVIVVVVAAALTVTVTEPKGYCAKFASAGYCAVKVYVPGARFDTAYWASVPLPPSAAVPSSVPF